MLSHRLIKFTGLRREKTGATMKVICTYCSGPKAKDRGLLPAVDRYLSERIGALHRKAVEENREFRILSGKFGLLRPEQAIPSYDHLLLPEEVARLVPQVAAALTDLPAAAVEYHTADPARYAEVAPYRELMEEACRREKIRLEIVLLEGNPD